MRRPGAKEQGFTLVELLLAFLIATIGLVAVFAFFQAQERVGRSQQLVIEAQQNSRIAAEFLARDIRSAGFGLDPRVAVRVEQNCRDNVWTSAGGEAALDGCPNGSDRITIHYRYTNTRLFGCDAGVCSSNNSDMLLILEPNQICPGGPGMCGDIPSNHPQLACAGASTMAMAGDPELCGGVVPCVVTWCAPAGFPCTQLTVDALNCTVGCGCGSACCPDGGSSCCTEINVAMGGGMVVDAMGARNGSPSVDVVRVYQLMDVDADGSTELVMSDRVVNNTSDTLLSSIYTVVANNIDDFQVQVNSNGDSNDFRTADCNSVNCWHNRDVYWGYEDGSDANLTSEDADYPFTVSPAVTADQGADGADPYATAGSSIRAACLDAAATNVTENTQANLHTWGCSNRVRGIRFHIAARTSRREFSGSSELVNPGFRPTLAGNARTAETYSTSPTITAGAMRCYPGNTNCGCGAAATFENYLTCTRTGNAQGYRWRIIENTVLMRNIAQ